MERLNKGLISPQESFSWKGEWCLCWASCILNIGWPAVPTCPGLSWFKHREFHVLGPRAVFLWYLPRDTQPKAHNNYVLFAWQIGQVYSTLWWLKWQESVLFLILVMAWKGSREVLDKAILFFLILLWYQSSQQYLLSRAFPSLSRKLNISKHMFQPSTWNVSECWSPERSQSQYLLI